MSEDLNKTPSTDEPGGSQEPKQEPATNNEPSFSIPEEYKEKGWAKTINSMNDLLKGYDGAMKLIGKRQKPESADEYEIPTEGRSDEQVKEFKNLLFEAGLSKEQGSKIAELYDGLAKKAQEDFSKKDEEFAASMVKKYGDKWDSITSETREVLDAIAPDKKDWIATKSNEELSVLASVVAHYKAKISELKGEDTTFMSDDNKGSTGSSSVEQIKSRMNEIRNDKNYFDDNPFNKDSARLKAEMSELRKKLSKIS